MSCASRSRGRRALLRCCAAANVPVGRDAVVLLEQALEQAIAAEDYALCATVRDELQQVRDCDPLLAAQRRLEAAVSAEDWAAAAAARDEVKALLPPPEPPAPRLECRSDCRTDGILVCVQSEYLPSRSNPADSSFLFRYLLSFTNESARPVQLLSRRWKITDANGAVHEIAGEGVVGQQPVILPGAKYAYSSFCPLPTSCGKMEGEFTFIETESAEPRTCASPYAALPTCLHHRSQAPG